MVRTEVDEGQAIQTVSCKDEREGPGIERYGPLVAFRYQACHESALEQHEGDCQEQNHILGKRLPVGEHQRITKAPTVTHRMGNSQVEGERGEGEHEEECQLGGATPTDGEEQIHAHHELHYGQEDCQHQGSDSWHQSREAESLGIVLYLILCASGINQFDHTREDECACRKQPGHIHHQPHESTLPHFLHRRLILSARTRHSSSCPYSWRRCLPRPEYYH